MPLAWRRDEKRTRRGQGQGPGGGVLRAGKLRCLVCYALTLSNGWMDGWRLVLST